MSEALLENHESIPQINREVSDYNDTATWLAEVLDGQMRSEFKYSLRGQELYAAGGEALNSVFDRAITDAETKVDNDQRYAFELRRRRVEKQEYEEIIAMAKGETSYNTLVVVSDFPQEVVEMGSDFGGYNLVRRQTMLRIISRQSSGEIIMTQQSLDLSDRNALEAIYNFMGKQTEPGELLGQRIACSMHETYQSTLPDTLMRVYDAELTRKRGGEWHAGRSSQDKRNTLDFAYRQADLIDVFLSSGGNNYDRYNLAAAITARFEGRQWSDSSRVERVVSMISRTSINHILMEEMQHFGRLAQNRGKSFNGCGSTVSSVAESELVSLGYGDSDKAYGVNEDKYGSLTFTCENKHMNTRPFGKLIARCSTCGVSVKC